MEGNQGGDVNYAAPVARGRGRAGKHVGTYVAVEREYCGEVYLKHLFVVSRWPPSDEISKGGVNEREERGELM